MHNLISRGTYVRRFHCAAWMFCKIINRLAHLHRMLVGLEVAHVQLGMPKYSSLMVREFCCRGSSRFGARGSYLTYLSTCLL